MAKKSKLQFWLLQILILVTILYISSEIGYIFQPIGLFLSTLFFPIFISGFLFYLLNPLVNLIQKLKIPRTLSIIIVYGLIIGGIVLAINIIAPTVTEQFIDLANELPEYVDDTIALFNSLANSPQYQWVMQQEYVSIQDIEQRAAQFAETLPRQITDGIGAVLGFMTNFTITVVTVPFLLFYMFKDGNKFTESVLRFFPHKYEKPGKEAIQETNKTLASYIQGQVTVALFVATLSFIGYLIIDLPYALVMALIVMVTNIIPYVGPFLGGAPAVIVALFDSPTKAIFVVVVIVVAQQIEGNVLSPLIIGKQLKIHPATIIILLLGAGKLAGILGLILAIPFYAVTKTIVIHIVKFIYASREEQTEEKWKPTDT